MITASHTSQDFEQELTALGERLVAMGTRTENQIALAIRAVVDRSDPSADRVIAGDAVINEDERQIDEQALQTLARRQPVAGDLRFITMCLKAVTDLERIGDLAVNIAQRAKEVNRLTPPRWHFAIEPLEASVSRALRIVLASLVGKDAAGAEAAVRAAAQIDVIHSSLFAALLAHIATDAASIPYVLPLTSMCRYLGRIGDHIKSLAEEIIYMVRGEHVRHPDA